MRKLIVDVSPIFYGALFSATNESKKNGNKKVDGLYEFDYADILLFKIFEELSTLKSGFRADEVVLAFDNPGPNGYWRKTLYDGYKSNRKKQRDISGINWKRAYGVFDEIQNLLKVNTSFKVISVESVEGDDVGFVLSKVFSDNGDTTTLHTLDHDWEYNLEHKNVELFKTRKTQKLHGIYVERTEDVLRDMRDEHCIIGDPGDGFGHIKRWTQFSPDFIAKYPKYQGKELELWNKHHVIDTKFQEKHGVSAYKQPRFGWKSFIKSGKSIQELFDENPIHKLNYDLNKSLGLPEGIPTSIQNLILEEYNNADDIRHGKELTSYFRENGMFELTGKLMNF